jgi:hypothetical protein
MSKLLAVPVVVLACLVAAGATTQGDVRDRGQDGLPNRPEKRYHPSTKNSAKPGSFPNSSTTGVRAGWRPARTRRTSLTVTTRGAVVKDILFTGSANLLIEADNVTVRNLKFQGSGQIRGDTGTDPDCSNGALIENVSFEYPGGYDPRGTPVIQWIGATVRRVQVQPGRSEGIFVGGKSEGCGPMRIEDTLIKIADGRDCDLHADGIQGYGGSAVTVRNVVADSSLANCGTAPFFYPHSQSNTRADIKRLLVIGGTYSFRLGMPGKVRGLRIGDKPPGPYGSGHSWAYGPIDVRCSAVSKWRARIVRFDSNYRVTRTIRSQACNSNGGG